MVVARANAAVLNQRLDRPLGSGQRRILAGDEVRTDLLRVDVQRVAVLVDEDRRSGVEDADAAELPAFQQQRPLKPVEARAERDVPDVADHQPVTLIVGRGRVLAFEAPRILTPAARRVQPALLVVVQLGQRVGDVEVQAPRTALLELGSAASGSRSRRRSSTCGCGRTPGTDGATGGSRRRRWDPDRGC